MSRENQVRALVADALEHGVVLHVSGAWGQGTVGPYQTAVPTRERYALFSVARGRQRYDRTYTSASDAADGALATWGTSNLINALKAAAKRRGIAYRNLKTPIPWSRASSWAEGFSATFGGPVEWPKKYRVTLQRTASGPSEVAWTDSVVQANREALLNPGVHVFLIDKLVRGRVVSQYRDDPETRAAVAAERRRRARMTPSQRRMAWQMRELF